MTVDIDFCIRLATLAALAWVIVRMEVLHMATKENFAAVFARIDVSLATIAATLAELRSGTVGDDELVKLTAVADTLDQLAAPVVPPPPT